MDHPDRCPETALACSTAYRYRRCRCARCRKRQAAYDRERNQRPERQEAVRRYGQKYAQTPLGRLAQDTYRWNKRMRYVNAIIERLGLSL